MRSSLPLVAAVLALAACSQRSSPEPRTPAAAPAKLGLDAGSASPSVIDQGTLRIRARGKPAGEETFKLIADGDQRELTSHTTLSRGDLTMVVEGKLVTDAAFRPRSGVFRHTARDAGGERKDEQILARGESGALTLTTSGSPPISEKQPSDLYIDNLIVSHLSPICSLAGEDDRALKLFPGVTLRVSGARELEFATKAGPRKLKVALFRVPGAEDVDLVCDGEKLVIVRQSSAQLETTREGYQEIAEIIAEAENRKPRLPEGLTELDRQVVSPAGGTPLGCSLVAPAEKRAPLPSVVLLGPAGPQDRDGDSAGHAGLKAALLKQLAIALGQSGIASLRCDDRGVGDSGGNLADATLTTLVVDAAAQVAALRREPGLDAARIGIVGHGEGATVAQLVAAGDPRVRALVLLAGMGRPLDAVQLDQRDAEMRRMGIKDEVIRAEHKRFAAIYDAIRAGRTVPEDTPDETRAALAPMVLYLQSHFRHDPAFTAKKIKVPVLVAHGGRDIEIPPGEAKILGRLLGRRATVKIYPELNHLFTPVKKGTAEDYSDPELAVDLAFVGDLVRFLGSKI